MYFSYAVKYYGIVLIWCFNYKKLKTFQSRFRYRAVEEDAKEFQHA